jgi:hypothetical protein
MVRRARTAGGACDKDNPSPKKPILSFRRNLPRCGVTQSLPESWTIGIAPCRPSGHSGAAVHPEIFPKIQRRATPQGRCPAIPARQEPCPPVAGERTEEAPGARGGPRRRVAPPFRLGRSLALPWRGDGPRRPERPPKLKF